MVKALDCPLTARLTLSPFFPELAAAIPSVVSGVLALQPSLLECLPDSTLLQLADPSTITVFTDSLLSTVLERRPNILRQLPIETLTATVQSRTALVANLPDEVLILIIADRQDVLPLLPDEDLIALVKLKPSILGLTFDHLPTSQLLMLLSSRPQLLQSLPTPADNIISRILGDRSNQNKLLKLVKAMSAKDLVALASSRPALVAELPDEVLAVLAQR